MTIPYNHRVNGSWLAVVLCLSVTVATGADEPKPRETWHLELRNIGGSVDYASPYSPVGFSPDSKRLAISLANRKSVWERNASDESSVVCKEVPEGSGIGIWDIESLQFLKWIETDAPKVIRFSPDGRSIAALDDSDLLRWDAETGEETRTTLIENATAFERLRHGFSWVADGNIVVLKTGAIVHYSSDGKQLKTFSIDTTLNIHTLESGDGGKGIVADCYYWDLAADRKVTEKHSAFCHSVFRPATSQIWGRSDRSYGAIGVWNPLTGKYAFPFREGLSRKFIAENGSPQYKVEGVAFSPNGKVLASIGSDSCIHLWNLKTGSRIATLEVTKGPRKGRDDNGVGRPALETVKFSPDGRWLMTCSVESVSIFKIDRLKSHIKTGIVHHVTQYFAGRELVEEIISNPRGAKTIVGSMLHTEEQKRGSRVAALMPGNDDVWYDAVVLGRVPSYSGKKGLHYNVHFEGYSREDDKIVPEWRLRPKLAHRLKIRDLK